MPIIEVENVTKVYGARRRQPLFSRMFDVFRGCRRHDENVVALEDVSFTVEAGDALGIIGSNGSGKSTLLKILAGVTVPTQGRVAVRGRVVSLLELGAGFHPLLTGRENIYLNGSILGMRSAQVNAVFDQIVDFSGIRDFIDQPVNTYSSGMYVRLAFAVAVHTAPDVFLVDEVLSVGDEEFQRKCRTRIGELRQQGKTIVFVSHDLGIVNTLCNRVVLLSKGRMVSRGTPQATIDYYLRQIGRDVGIHTMAGGGIEVIFCHGRISVFRDQREASSSSGFRMNLQSMGQWYESGTADWVVEERTPTSCRARGRMSRLPVTLVWDLSVKDGCLVWGIRIECEQDVALRVISAELFWPLVFVRWQYEDKAGLFPNILPGDVNWNVVVPAEPTCRETAAFPREGSGVSPVLLSVATDNPYIMLSWSNSDFVVGSRVFLAAVYAPDSTMVFQTGQHSLMTVTVNLGLTDERLREHLSIREQERTVSSGSLVGRFESGKIRLINDGVELTKFLHFYASMLIEGLWNDSVHLQWFSLRREGDRLLASGESRRFPYAQHWEITPVEDGIGVRIMLEVREPMDVTEYHASVVLKSEYTGWETPYERGVYPEFDREHDDWRHANRVYQAGVYAKALSPVLPSVTMRVTADEAPFRMTAINTSYHENARVLQALRTTDAGALHFEKGMYLYFSGTVSVGREKV